MSDVIITLSDVIIIYSMKSTLILLILIYEVRWRSPTEHPFVLFILIAIRHYTCTFKAQQLKFQLVFLKVYGCWASVDGLMITINGCLVPSFLILALIALKFWIRFWCLWSKEHGQSIVSFIMKVEVCSACRCRHQHK